jgi:hypothetical protein
LKPIEGGLTPFDCLGNGACVDARVQQPVRQKETVRIGFRTFQAIQTAKGHVHCGKRVLALPPTVCGLSQMGQRLLRRKVEMGRGEQRPKSLVARIDDNVAVSTGRNQDSPSAEHQPFLGKPHGGVDFARFAGCGPGLVQSLSKHRSLPDFRTRRMD